ncbi:L,D-transpeptidase [Streptomyces sp. NPDC001480]|uniref:L,D-transpeptidase n=1 Tax=Streptomyces sp. NPDC001480 TaxID=3364577 RepID=UPI0036C6E68F
MSDDLTTGLRQLAEAGETSPSASGAEIRRRAGLRRRRRRTGAVAGTVAAVAVVLTLVLRPGGPEAGRTSPPAARPTGTSSPRVAPDARVDLSTRLLAVGGRELPVSSGLPGAPTPTGRMTVIAKTRTRLVSPKEIGMRAGSGYRYTLPLVIRLRADDGKETYLAAMPYDEKAPGNRDVTTGWIGLRSSDAKWLYGRLRLGAVVDIVGRSPAEPRATS